MSLQEASSVSSAFCCGGGEVGFRILKVGEAGGDTGTVVSFESSVQISVWAQIDAHIGCKHL